jgi:hypothetical protein
LKDCQNKRFGKIASSIFSDTISRAQELCWFTILFIKQLRQTWFTQQSRQTCMKLYFIWFVTIFFCWPSFSPHWTLLEQGYKSWGVIWDCWKNDSLLAIIAMPTALMCNMCLSVVLTKLTCLPFCPLVRCNICLIE